MRYGLARVVAAAIVVGFALSACERGADAPPSPKTSEAPKAPMTSPGGSPGAAPGGSPGGAPPASTGADKGGTK
jgi:hypothetical protein